MLRKHVIIFFVLLHSVSSKAGELTYHTRLILHSHRTIADSDFGVAGWVIAPDITSSPSTWLAMAGGRYNGDGWNAEMLAGAVFNAGDAKALVDMRVELTPKLWGIPAYSWHNLQWVKTGNQGTGYWYSQLDWVVPYDIGLLGVETENTFNSTACDFSIAPQVILPLGGHLVLIAAPQFHFNKEGDYTGLQMWIRAVVNL